jgi:predicted XRE-type DNA-binding protein
MSTKQFSHVWDAIEDTHAESESMKLRSSLMMTLAEYITHTKLNQSEAARLFGVTQPRISDLMRGKINLFALDALVNMATAAGLHIEMSCYVPPIHTKRASKKSVLSGRA